jgi:O-antigen/teichoic acid export membrane protein
MPAPVSLNGCSLSPEPYLPSTLRPALLSAYGFSFLSQACDLAFYVVLFKFLPLTGVGRFSWVMAVMVFVGLILDLGISPALTREFSQHKTALWVVFRQAARVRFPGFLLSLLLFGVWIVARKPESELGAALLLGSLGLAVRTFTTVFAAWLYAVERQPAANFVSALSSLGRLVVGVALIGIARSTDVAWLFAALLLVEVFGAATAWALCHRVLKETPCILASPGTYENDFAGVPSRLRAVGLSFGAITVLAAVQNRLDWLLVSYFLSVKALALYSMANKCFEVARTLVALALSSAFPWMCREKGQCGPGLGIFFTGLLVGSVFIALAGALVGPEALSLIWGQKYAGSEAAVRLLMLLAIPATFDAIAYDLLVASGAERFIVWASIVATCIQVGLDVLLIPRWGIQGAVAGMFAAIVAVGILFGIRARRQLRALGWYWTLFPLFLLVGGLLIIQTEAVVWHRVLFGLCLWALASSYALFRDLNGLLRSIGLKPKLANDRAIR